MRFVVFLALLCLVDSFLPHQVPLTRKFMIKSTSKCPDTLWDIGGSRTLKQAAKTLIAAFSFTSLSPNIVWSADEAIVKVEDATATGFPAPTQIVEQPSPETKTIIDSTEYDFGAFKLPYNHENLEFRQFLGKKATILFNMKIDDPQTVLQFPDLAEIYRTYKSAGLNVHAFPTEQGWFEPDDDETCRAKAKEFYTFGGDYPNSVVFDKIDILGPSSHPMYAALTKKISTPNGYGRITLNYEKFLLDANGNPVRRYPRKFTAYDMESDIKALLADQPLPEESPAFKKAWREAKREVIKSEYAFRFNYNYYDSPESMYKYNPLKDK